MLISSSKDFAKLTTADQTELLLQIMREESSEDGRLTCSPSFKAWIMAQVQKRDYYLSPVFCDITYTPAYGMLKNLGLVERLAKPHGSKPTILRVDQTTSVDKAKELKKKLNAYFAADLAEAFEHVEGSNSVGFIVESQRDKADAEKDRLIDELRRDNARLEGIVKVTLQDAEKFAKDARNRLKQA